MKFLKIISVVIVLLISVPAIASDWESYQKSGDKNPKWDDYIQAGFTSFDSGNLGPAEMFLQRAIARGCEDGLVYVKIGLYNEAQRNYKKAIEYLKKAAPLLQKQYPNHEMTRSIDDFLGRNFFLSGDKNEAIPYLQRGAEKDSFTALYFLGQIYRDKQQLDDAGEYFQKALSAKHPEGLPPSVDILIMTELGKILYTQKRIDKSYTVWVEILKHDPANQVALSYKNKIDKDRYSEKEKKVMEEMTK